VSECKPLLRGCSEQAALASTALWLFNPFTFAISTRGSCESVVSMLMLMVLHCLLRGRVAAAAAVYGLATHLRIYPIIYALPLVIFLGGDLPRGNGVGNAHAAPVPGDASLAGVLRRLGSQGGVVRLNLGRLGRLVTNKRVVIFAAVSSGMFIALGAVCYAVYGDDFLREAFLFHLSRNDIRHNFAHAFYGVYLAPADGGDSGSGGGNIYTALAGKMLAMLPQLAVVVLVGIKYARDLPFCLFLQTLGFVAFNKVCTAQYFVWYFCLMPLAVPGSGLLRTPGGGGGGGGGGRGRNVGCSTGDTSRQEGGIGSLPRIWASVVVWLLAQIQWLSVAYLLEFCGLGVFLLLWGASVVFLGANVWLMFELVSAHSPAIRGMTTSIQQPIMR